MRIDVSVPPGAGPALAVAILLAATTSLGQPSASEEAVAETLFHEASALIRAGNYAEACPKLAASHSADPAGGTVLLLAICYQETGRTASAWLRFNESLAMARSDRRDDRVMRAREHLAALEPRLNHLTVAVLESERTLPGFRLEVDGASVPLVGSSTSLPLDPGEHTIIVSATDKVAWSRPILVAGEGTRTNIDVPALADAPAPPAEPDPVVAADPSPTSAAPTPSAESTPPRRSTQRTVAVLVGFAGLAATGVGSYFGVVALDHEREGSRLCPEPECTNADGVELIDDAFDDGTRASVLIAAGASGIAVGTLLYFTAEKRRPRTELTVKTGRRAAFIGVRTAF